MVSYQQDLLRVFGRSTLYIATPGLLVLAVAEYLQVNVSYALPIRAITEPVKNGINTGSEKKKLYQIKSNKSL